MTANSSYAITIWSQEHEEQKSAPAETTNSFPDCQIFKCHVLHSKQKQKQIEALQG